MSFEVKIKKTALKFISGLDKSARERILKALLLLKEDPVPVKMHDISKISGAENTYRIRIGKIRILYEVFWNDKTILVHMVDFRKTVYKR